ncbi:MAG: DinB family protein [Saprospiraceae bacterium]|nr:DinB family protein [Saprospiraceae bacterium]
MQILINHIIQQLEENLDGKPWVGPSYKRVLSGINENNAFKRPLPELHSVAEIISHLNTWLKEALLKIKTRQGSLTDESEENWYSNEKLMEKGWTSLLHEFQTNMTEFIEILKTKEDRFLKEEYYDTDFKGNYPYSFVINGMLHHNIYHLGQLGIIIKYLNRH